MLLTYRLIFGQDAKSYKLFKREMDAVCAAASSPPLSLSLPSKSKPKPAPPPCIFSFPDADPMLPLLCSRRWNSAAAAPIYDDLKADEPQTHYTPSSYPFFAEKLLAIQSYVKDRNPHDWKAMWHDTRNKNNWWQFWAVLFIGGGTLLFGFLGLALQVAQVVLAQKQLVLQNSPLPVPPATGL
jgi:hypothetical protein